MMLKIKYRESFNPIFFAKKNSTVSLIGEGFNRDNRIVSETLTMLSEKQIDDLGLTTTSFRLSLLIRESELVKFIKVLHNYWIE